ARQSLPVAIRQIPAPLPSLQLRIDQRKVQPNLLFWWPESLAPPDLFYSDFGWFVPVQILLRQVYVPFGYTTGNMPICHKFRVVHFLNGRTWHLLKHLHSGAFADICI